MLRKIVINTCLAFALTFTHLVFPVHPALAAGCTGANCNGKDPGTTGCSTGAYSVATRSIYHKNGRANPVTGVIELRWSNTCKTNWAKVKLSKVINLQVFLRDKRGNMLYDSSHMTHAMSAYGQMWYAPTQPVKACVHIQAQEYCTILR